MEYKNIAVSPKVYERLAALAEREHRTIGGQVAELLERYLLVSVNFNPHPRGAEPVIVAEVKKAEAA